MSAEHVLTPDDKCPCGQPQEGSGYCSYECYSKHDEYAVDPNPAPGMPHTPTKGEAAEPPELAAIRSRDAADYVTGPGKVAGPRAKELMQARLDRRALLAALDDELSWNCTPDSEMPRLAAQPLASAPGAVQESTDRGTGERKAHGSTQAVELVPGVWISSGRQNGKTTEAITAAVEAARPVHYREAANSLRGYAAGRQIGGTYDSRFTDGITAAADRVDSYARDLDEEASR
jgi:hypothetical protein